MRIRICSRQLFFVVAVLAALCVSTVFAQRQIISLRGVVAPACSQTSTLKYADIYGEGNIAVQGSYNCDGAFIYDISNPDAPTLANWYNPTPSRQFLEAIIVNGRGYFGSGDGGGVHIVDLSVPTNPVLLGIVNPTNGGGFSSIHEMNVIVQNGVTLLIENRNTTTDNQLKVIDVTNPAAPVFVRNIEPQEIQWVHAMHIRGDRMFTSGWGNSSTRGRTEIWNIANLATQAPTILGFIEDGSSPVTNGNRMHSSWTSEDGNYLYSARELLDGDLRVYDIRNPAQPILVRSIKAGDYGLNAISPHNPAVMGNVLYVSWYQAGVQVFVIGQPSNPIRVGQYDTYPEAFAPEPEEREALANADPWDIFCGSDSAGSGLPTSYQGNWAIFPNLGTDRILAGDMKGGLFVLKVYLSPVRAPQNDFDGDGKTDLSIFRPSTDDWQIETSSNGDLREEQFGMKGDVTVTGDYDGDRRSDLAVFRPSTGVWYLNRSTAGFSATRFGLEGDVPVAGDYDSDGRTDIAVWRPSTGMWYIQQSVLGFKAQTWGMNGDVPVSGDYDNDGKIDIAVWRPTDGTWYVLPSTSSIGIYRSFGMSGDVPLSGDFDDNGVSDFAVFRPSTGVWYILDPLTGAQTNYHFGLADDMPIPADYDGDHKTDIAVFRPSSSEWYRINSSDGSSYVRTFGEAGDRPSSSSVQAE